MGQVKIGREFFKNASKDYRDANWAFVREILQNSIDAPGCNRIDIQTAYDRLTTEVTVANNGEPMTEEVLVGKLLTLGESGKRFQPGQDGVAKTGGFGKAKELLYFSQLKYGILTGDINLTGEGGEYELFKADVPFHGTKSSVLMERDVKDHIDGAFRRFCQLTQWSGVVTLNGERLLTSLRKGHHRRDFDWCKIWTNQQHKNLVVVRINGTPMFTRTTPFKGCVIVELTGDSGSRLSANRDSLLWRIGEELDQFLSNLAVDKRSALREKKAEYKRYEGERLRAEACKPKAAGDLLDLLVPVSSLNDDETMTESTSERLAAFVRGGDAPVRSGGIATQTISRLEGAVSIGPQFILKNTTGMETPDYYSPGPLFSDYSRKLALAWAKVLVELHQILELSAEFSIGFCLDEDTAAESELSGAYGQVYYLNPAEVVAQRSKPQCRSFRKRFTGAWNDRFEIISVACHELVHGAYGLSAHDEDFSSRFGDVVGVAFANLGRLTPLFRG